MSIFSALMATTEAVGSVASGGGGRYFGSFSGSNAAGVRVTPHAAKRLPVFFACVAKRATSMAMLPCKIMTDGGGAGRKTATDHPLYSVLYRRPNHIQSAFEFWWMMEAHLCMRGNAYAEIITDANGIVQQLLPMHPDCIQVERLMGSGRMRYRYSDPLTNTVRVLLQEEVLHRRENPDEIGVGQSRILIGCEALGLAVQRQQFMARFMRNDATPGAVFTGANFKNTADEDEFVDSVQKARTGANAGRPYMLPPGMDMKSLGFTAVEAQLIESAKLSDTQLCTLMGVLPHTVGVDAGKAATFASTEQFNLMDVQQRVLPQCIAAEQDIQRYLLEEPFYAKFGVASLMRGDAATRAAYYEKRTLTGSMCPDEVRELEDENPIPGGAGQKFWMPLNYGHLDRDPAMTPPAKPGVGVPVDEDGPVDDSSSEDDEEGDDEQARRSAKIVAQLGDALVQYARTTAIQEAA